MRDSDNRRSGFGGALAVGARPALLVIDFQSGFTDPAISPLAADCSDAIDATNQLIGQMRRRGPVIFTVCAYHADLRDAGLWRLKCPTLTTLRRGTPACALDPRLSVEMTDLVLEKTQASAFFGTPLAGLLGSQCIDTLFVAGCTTSGCVRASVVDALAHGFAPFVVETACSDRSSRQHTSNLIDMRDKYAEVIDLEQALSLISTRSTRQGDTS